MKLEKGKAAILRRRGGREGERERGREGERERGRERGREGGRIHTLLVLAS